MQIWDHDVVGIVAQWEKCNVVFPYSPHCVLYICQINIDFDIIIWMEYEVLMLPSYDLMTHSPPICHQDETLFTWLPTLAIHSFVLVGSWLRQPLWFRGVGYKCERHFSGMASVVQLSRYPHLPFPHAKNPNIFTQDSFHSIIKNEETIRKEMCVKPKCRNINVANHSVCVCVSVTNVSSVGIFLHVQIKWNTVTQCLTINTSYCLQC